VSCHTFVNLLAHRMSQQNLVMFVFQLSVSRFVMTV